MELTQNGVSVVGRIAGGNETGYIVGTVDGSTFSFTQVWSASGNATGKATVHGDQMCGCSAESGGSGTFRAHRGTSGCR
jgi:hypothetical protein